MERYRIKKVYDEVAVPALTEKFNYSNPMEVPKLVKIIINMGLGALKDNSKSFQVAVDELTRIAGQKAVVTKARKSIANFKLRQGQPIGAKVTLRGNKMYDFCDKLFSIALPRVRDFKGVNDKAFDGKGNYSLGLKEQLIFPEINYEEVEMVRGMDICFVTTAKTDDEARELLRLIGMPFAK
ncbi:MAG: 50S ribosomal protein L5 [Clostridia bacterium]|nr:50S ribosomal protein L5 [Clostridia bacterium]